jgi:Flp pilus assembly protein protease CpaA
MVPAEYISGRAVRRTGSLVSSRSVADCLASSHQIVTNNHLQWVFANRPSSFFVVLTETGSWKVPMSDRSGNGGPVGRNARGAGLAVTAGALVVGWAASVDTDLPWLLFSALLGWALLALAWTDWHALRLPDALTLPLTGAGLIMAWCESQGAFYSGVIGAACGYGALVAISLGYRRLRKREGLGRGDAKLLAAGGAWLGWAALPTVVLIAALLGLVLALAQRTRGAKLTSQTKIPFGPALALAIWLIWIYRLPFD